MLSGMLGRNSTADTTVFMSHYFYSNTVYLKATFYINARVSDISILICTQQITGWFVYPFIYLSKLTKQLYRLQ
jgi:hypothetical protein